FMKRPATSEIYTLSYTTLFRSLLVRGAEDREAARLFVEAEQVDEVQRRLDSGLGTVLDVVSDIEQLAHRRAVAAQHVLLDPVVEDRKSTRLNSSHLVISYAVFC